MVDYFSLKRFFYDLFAYLVFLGSSYLVFATNFSFRYVLIPVTFFAFFSSIVNAYSVARDRAMHAAAVYVTQKYGSGSIDNEDS
jgi:hypothetical protein